MAAKYQLITELYRRTGKAVTGNPQAWQNFLASACRNYKCRFDEQLLIYAQRPDAVAVAGLETWNRQFKRWVNKDSRGIAVFDPKGRRNTLKYYFDISDTHEGYYGSRPVPIWQMERRYEQAVMERLSDRFGETSGSDLASVLMETAENAVADNLPDYAEQLKGCVKGSFLEELDGYNIEVIYRRLAVNSVAFMLMSRCGLDTEGYFEREDFAGITDFNTPATLNAIGIATSDIAEMALREISFSIRNVQMAEKSQNRTFAQQPQSRYDVDRTPTERSDNNERNHLQQTGGLPYSRPHITDRARNSSWQVRYDAQGLSGAAQESDLPQPADVGQAERTPAPDRAGGSGEIGAFDEAALQGAGSDGGTQGESTDAVGRADEQHPQSSGGSNTERADFQLAEPEPATDGRGSVANEEEVRANLPTVEEQMEMIAEAEDEKSSAFSVSQEDIDAVLVKGNSVEHGKYRIYHQFQKQEDKKSNVEFLKKEYGTGGFFVDFPDGTEGYVWYAGKGISIDRNGISTNHDLVLSWSKVEKRLRELIRDNRYLNPKEKDHYADYLESISAPKYEIDAQRKMARQRFIDAHRDLQPADKRDTLSLRLSDFIRDLDGYEKGLLSEVGRTDLADVTADQMERYLSDPAAVQQLIDFLALVQRKTTDVYSRSNAYRFSQELMELHPIHYLFHEDDVVYIGADKYEISAFDENAVSLRNVEFPLFGKEYSRADFEEKLKENPANDHLKVIVTESQKTEIPAEEKPDSIRLSIGFSEHPAFYDKAFRDRYTELGFALGNKLLGVLDEKQHREREDENNQVGWYHKTDFTITAVIGGEEYTYEGRFDIGDGEGDLIAHIKNFYDYSLSPACPFIPEWKKEGGDYYREKMESLRWGRDVFVPFLTQHTELTPEDETFLAEIMSFEKEWFVPAEEEKAAPRYTVEQTSDAFADPFIIRDNAIPEGQDGQYYDVGGIYQTFETEEEAQGYADTLNRAERETEQNGEPAPSETVEKQDNSDLIGRKITIDNRSYLIESVGEISGDVSLRDITFQNNVGFPINRVEKISYIRRLLGQQAEKGLPPEEKAETAAEPVTETVAEYPAVENGLPYDIVVEKIRFGEPEQKQEKENPAHSEERRNFRITDDALGVGGAKEKFRNNMAAIRLLHDLQIENRLATPEEQETLSKYVGWGGLSMAFDANNAAWANEYRELKSVLSDEEYHAAMESTLTAFYTPPVVIKAMYEALDRLGFKQGNVLEPCCATGNFFGLLPESMGKAKLHGIEIDPLSGRIAKQLYQKASIAIEGFEDTKLPDSHFDVVLGNVPFGEFKVEDSRYNAQKFLIHDYFFGATRS